MDEVGRMGGIPVTTPARTAFDLGVDEKVSTTSVIHLDALANATGVDAIAVRSGRHAPPGHTRHRPAAPQPST